MKILKRFFLGLLPVVAGVATAATFNLFSPANGILVGSPSTYVTTAATSTNVIGLWTGTCNNGTYLRGDGTCNTPPGTGVSSVGLTMPTGFSVGGSPVTSSGTLAVTTALSGIIKGTGTGFTTATSADVIGLWSGTCNASSFLRGDGACAAGASGTVTSVGLTMPGVFSVTGSPVTTSGTLAVAASGTSGGIPYFNSSTTMASSGALGANQLVLGGGAGTTPATLGSLGTTTTVLHGNAAGAPTFGAVSLTADVTGTLPVANGGTGVTSSTGTGSVVLSASPTFTGTVSAATVAATAVTVGGNNVCQSTGTNCPSFSGTTGSATGTVVGCTTSPTIAFNYEKVGNIVTVTFAGSAAACTSNDTSFTITSAVPASMQPASSRTCPVAIQDNGVSAFGLLAFNNSSTVAVGNGPAFSLWTNSGTKGLLQVLGTCTYLLTP